MKIHPVFSPNKLHKAASNPLLGQEHPEPKSMQIDSEDEWEVERILTSHIIYNQLEYRVKWLRFDEDLEWYPACNFISSPHLI